MTVGLKRVAVILLSILIQIAFIGLVFWVFPELWQIFVIAFTLMAVIVMLLIIRYNISPDYKLTWIFVIFISPVLGTIIFLISKRQLFKKYDSNLVFSREFNSRLDDDYDDFLNKNVSMKKQAYYLKKRANANIYKNNSTKYYKLGEELWRDLLIELEKAEKFIFMEYFIVEDGIMLQSIVDILMKKAAEGVEIRFLFDSFGSLLKAPDHFSRDLNRAGIKCIAFNSKIRILNFGFNNRDHRKITVIDGKVAFTGGINLADEYINKVNRFGHWKDTGIRIKGSSVDSFTKMFLTLWGICKDELPDYNNFILGRENAEVYNADAVNAFVAPYTDYPRDGEEVGATMYGEMVNSSQNYVYITSPYLILDYNMMNDLIIAAKSGVDVRIIVPGVPDKKTIYMLTRSFYTPLLKSGVRIFEYTPGFIHSKQFVSDDSSAIIGTINLDYRSLTHHIENAVWLVNTETVKDIKVDFLETQSRSREVDVNEKRNSLFMEVFVLPILRAFAPLF